MLCSLLFIGLMVLGIWKLDKYLTHWMDTVYWPEQEARWLEEKERMYTAYWE